MLTISVAFTAPGKHSLIYVRCVRHISCLSTGSGITVEAMLAERTISEMSIFVRPRLEYGLSACQDSCMAQWMARLSVKLDTESVWNDFNGRPFGG